MRLKFASRKSDLARWQAVQTARAFEALPEKPSIEYLFKASLGDQDLDTPLAQMGAKGVFTEDFYQDLLNGTCDAVIHSWKDLPVEDRVATKIAMTLPRADTRDLLIVPESVWQEAERTRRLPILTSSPRRVYNLGACLPELLPGEITPEFINVRGNVPTRLGKMHAQKAALVLAKAGADRLLAAEDEGFLLGDVSLKSLLKNCRFMVLPMSVNPAAAAQGALAIEVAREHDEVLALCAKLNHEQTFQTVQREREILQGYGGGCHQKIGTTILVRDYGQVFALRGLTDSGEALEEFRVESQTPWSKAKSRDAIFPVHAKDNSWFEREAIAVDFDLSASVGLIVAREDGLPADYTPPAKQWVWTAGVRTWTRLARRGVWVSGCFDGLGESEAMGVEAYGAPKVFTKLSHAGGHQRGGHDFVATYRLRPKKDVPDLKGKTHFFWMSGSSFERAQQFFPQEIGNGFHACGPGSTFDQLRRLPGLKHPVKVFAGLDQFLSETLP